MPKIYKSSVPPAPVVQESIYSYLFNTTNVYPPTDPAFVDAADGTTITRGALKDLTLRLAYGLRQHVLLPCTSNLPQLTNLARGDMIMIMSPNSMSWPIALFGCVAAGLRITMASSSSTARELLWQWQSSNARTILVAPTLVPVVRDMLRLAGFCEEEANRRIWVMDKLWDPIAPKLSDHNWLGDLLNHGILSEEEKFNGRDSDEPVYICYSSGTTGRPKGVETTHKNIATVLGATKVLWSQVEKETDVYMGLLPVYHMFGLAITMHYPFFSGKPLVMVNSGFEPASFCKAIEEYRITTLMLVPPLILILSTHSAVDEYDLRSVTNISSGGASLSTVVASKLLTRLRAKGSQAVILQGQWCGSTETTCPAQMVAPVKADQKLGSVGELMPNIEARLVEDSPDARDVEEGQAGEMWLRGPTIMRGYLNNPDANASTFTQDGWFKTGDILRRDDDGYYYIVDRKKEMIKYKGYQVAPAELEALLLENPEVADVGVIGIKDEYSGDELPRAYVAPVEQVILKHPLEKNSFEKRVQKWVEGQVSHYKYLRGGVVAIESIPKSATGKILRKDLRELANVEAKKLSKMLSARL
ncbi:acyl-CoA synthetase [Cyathus striatus]|nr:acyl-CoA synthetase [Cyathus striatus]